MKKGQMEHEYEHDIDGRRCWMHQGKSIVEHYVRPCPFLQRTCIGVIVFECAPGIGNLALWQG